MKAWTRILKKYNFLGIYESAFVPRITGLMGTEDRDELRNELYFVSVEKKQSVWGGGGS